MNTLPDAWIRTFVAEQCNFTLDEDAMSLAWVVHEICEDFGDMRDPTLMEQTLVNPTCPGCGSSADISLIPTCVSHLPARLPSS